VGYPVVDGLQEVRHQNAVHTPGLEKLTVKNALPVLVLCTIGIIGTIVLYFVVNLFNGNW
jgi:hypothetical protein